MGEFIIEAMNKEFMPKLNMIQWNNPEDIDWFKSINEKQLCKFFVFHVKNFYPSMKESLLKQTLDFLENYIKVSNEDKNHHNNNKTIKPS